MTIKFPKIHNKRHTRARVAYFAALLLVAFLLTDRELYGAVPIYHLQDSTSIRTHLVVTSSLTQLPISSVSVARVGDEKSRPITLGHTDSNGVLSYEIGGEGGVLIRIRLEHEGYHPLQHTYASRRFANDTLHLVMSPEPYLIDSLLVEADRSKYDPNNPAAALVKSLVASESKKHSARNEDYSFLMSDQMTLALSNFDLNSKFLNRLFPFFQKYVKQSKIDDTWTLPLSQREMIAQMGWNASEQATHKLIRYRNHIGLDQNIDDGSMTMGLEELFTHIDLFKNRVKLLDSQFASPLSKNGEDYYKYYLTDTLVSQGHVAYVVNYYPYQPSDYTFRGTLYITSGSDPKLLRSEISVPDAINLNFLDQLKISQYYGPTDKDRWGLKEETMAVSFRLHWQLLSFYVEQSRKYQGHEYERADPAVINSNPRLQDLSGDSLSIASIGNIQENELLVTDAGLKGFLSDLRKFPLYKTILDASDMLTTGYIRTGWKSDRVYGGSKFDVGPIGAMVGRNHVEGLRLRLGGQTTGYLNKKVFAEGFLAYGFKDQRWKYSATATYSFVPKRYFKHEYPQKEISLTYRNDLFTPGQIFENNDKDNILYNIGTSYLANRSYREMWMLEYINDLRSDIQIKLKALHMSDRPLSGEEYVRVERHGNDTTLIRVPQITDASVGIALRYAPGERIYNGSMQRQSSFYRRIRKEVPVFLFSYELGTPLLGGEFVKNRTELSVSHRMWMGDAGRLDYDISIGKLWNSVPYPMLYTPPVNRAYALNNRAFQVLRPYELIGDEWGTAFAEWHLRGLVFNRIPLLSKTKLRGVVSVNYLYGNTSKKNQQRNSKELFVLPTIATEMNHTHYVEMGIGLENIARIFRVDAYRRITPEGPYSQKSPWVIRFRVGLSF